MGIRWGKEIKVDKYVPRNDGDTDNDQIPGFADGLPLILDEANLS